MIKALFVAPYKGLAEMVKRMTIPEYIDLKIVIGDLEEGLAIVEKETTSQKYDVIISRGGTAQLIEEASPIPVIHIDITGYDMLRVFTLLRGVNEKIALVGFENISRGASIICNILDFNVNVVTIHDKDEVEEKLLTLKKNGYSIVIGDVVTVNVAEDIGMQGILITSGEEAILAAFEEAQRLHNLFKKTTKQMHSYKKIFNQFPLPIVVLKHHNILDANTSFKRQFLKANKTDLPLFIKNNLHHFYKDRCQKMIVEDDKLLYELLAVNVNEQDATICLVVSSWIEKKKIDQLNVIHDITYEPIIGDSEFTKTLKKKVDQAAFINSPLCIIGETGTGKMTIAKQIHFKKFGKKSSLILIEAPVQEEKLLTEFTYLEKQLISNKEGTIVIKDVHLIDKLTQKVILKKLNRLKKAYQIIGITNKVDVLKENPLLQEFFTSSLHIPPLRQRKADIKSFVDYFLTKLHTADGKDVIGIRKEALDELLKYDWPGNVTELKKVLQELRLETDTNFIEKEIVASFMQNLEEMMMNHSDQKVISLDGTLEDIEKRIIEMVLAEENYHQSNTAKRLGINRTTLWRKLKG